MVDRLEDMGFYTLEDARAAAVDETTPLWRCELILTSACNFACPYCRGIEKEHCGALKWEEALRVLDYWCDNGLRNVRFSGGEPTLWKRLPELVAHARSRGVRRVAVSTNGSASADLYERLVAAGANDFSVSLDACCAETGDRMAGGKRGSWDRVVGNVRLLAALTYVTVGVVLTEDNIEEFRRIVLFASRELGVADIRVISAAQWNEKLAAIEFPDDVLVRHPILRYRMTNMHRGRHVRGLRPGDNRRCPLVLDDMAVLDGDHYPCIIYMREMGRPIGKLGADARAERLRWYRETDVSLDPICSRNCLDVCVDYNNRVCQLGMLKATGSGPVASG